MHNLAVGLVWLLACATVASSQPGNENHRKMTNLGLGNWTTDYASDIAADSASYDRCKDTTRCNRAFAIYNVSTGRYSFRKERFHHGRTENADLFLSFEDWRAGTVGLGVDQVRLAPFPKSIHDDVHDIFTLYRIHVTTLHLGLQAYLLGLADHTKGAHFNSFSLEHPIPTPKPNATFKGDLVFNTSSISLLFNTTGVPTLTIFNSSCASCVPETWVGDVGVTEQGTETGLFNFYSIFLGPTVNVTVTGDRALVIMSRSTAVFDTPITVQPGTLGVSPILLCGWRSAASPASCFPSTTKSCWRL